MVSIRQKAPPFSALKGKQVLVVEDEYLLAADLAITLERNGASVAGPFASVEDAMAYLATAKPPDFAILDVNLRGEMVFPVADHLLSAGIPFMFVTGYDLALLPATYSKVPCIEKPIDLW